MYRIYSFLSVIDTVIMCNAVIFTQSKCVYSSVLVLTHVYKYQDFKDFILADGTDRNI
jgi:hypothetical protein